MSSHTTPLTVTLYRLPLTSLPPSPAYPPSLSRIHPSHKLLSLSSLLLKAHLVPNYTLTPPPYKKPVHEDYVFNVSHDQDICCLAVMGINTGMIVGLDVVVHKPLPKHTPTVSHYVSLFTSQIPPLEISWIGSDLTRFYYVWSCREAFFKMIGTGLLGDVLEYDFEFGEIMDEPRVRRGGVVIPCKFFTETSTDTVYIITCCASSFYACPSFSSFLPPPPPPSPTLPPLTLLPITLSPSTILPTYTSLSSSTLVPYDPTSKLSPTLKQSTFHLSLSPTIYLTLNQAYQPDSKGGTSLGFGASVYPCSIVLSLYIFDHLPEEGRFIELGAGPGLVGVVCKVKGWGGVVTDGDEKSCGLARGNLGRVEGGEVKVERYRWGERGGGVFEWLFMSDVVARPYVEAMEDLVKSLEMFFEGNADLKVLFSYQKRGGGEERFWNMCEEKGWKMERIEDWWIRSEWRKEGIEIWRIMKS
ncbi:hypothetical protein TrST_g3550 [Triparma strigata]|uniref:4'-phosphopantetheinyl transferase domain-containing protein n=1 Tax=Triparma strigata TaxID=1606541 RepID=A0A9W7AXI8_9STRA|nr:hypothetical protein TrST_g3550 [Triparma strigata]